MIIISREDWGGPNFMPLHIGGGLKDVVAHHTAGAPVAPTMEAEMAYVRQVDRMHVERGWVAGGYGFMGFQSGRIYEIRGWRNRGAHCPPMNGKSLGFAFHLHGRHEFPSKAIVESFRALMARGVREGHLAPDWRLTGHRDHMATECPGDKLYAALVALRHEPAKRDDWTAQALLEDRELPGVPPMQGWLRRLALPWLGRRDTRTRED